MIIWQKMFINNLQLQMKPKFKVQVQKFEDVQQDANDSQQQPKPPPKKLKKIKKHKHQNPQPQPTSQTQPKPSSSQPLNPSPPKPPTLSHLAVCLPDSLVSLPQSSLIRSYFLSQIARICSLYRVDQIIVLHDHTYTSKSDQFNPSQYMVRNLQYLETPQYLRKSLFEMHSDLKNAGIMNPIECDHHLKVEEVGEFREGVVLARPVKDGKGSWVDIGLRREAQMDLRLEPKTRVTLRVGNYQEENPKYYEAVAIPRSVPKIEKNLYWGYNVRLAMTLKSVFKSQPPYTKRILINHRDSSQSSSIPQIPHLKQASFQDGDRVLLFFSGYESLESMVQNDEGCRISLKALLESFTNSLVFGKYGVKQLRIQEQLFITLGQVRECCVV